MADILSTDEVNRLLAKAGKFKPHAYFQQSLDAFYVFWRDCSHTEIQLCSTFSFFVDNHPEEGQDKVVGFAWYGLKAAGYTDNDIEDLVKRISEYI